MLFPTSSTFVIRGMLPGKTKFWFNPYTKGKKLVDILYNGQSYMDRALETKLGEDIQDVRLVMGE